MAEDDGVWRPLCPVCWGSHGCDLPPGHDPAQHQCDTLDDGPCCRIAWDGKQWVRWYWDNGLSAYADSGDHFIAHPFMATSDEPVPTP
jgi:hypothetical protein